MEYHELNGRGFYLLVPSCATGRKKLPVIVCLHGNGGQGHDMLGQIAKGMPDLAAAHILVAPDGPHRSWNIKAEGSKEDDQLYVGTSLIEHLVTFENVDASSFTLYGWSNGAALANRILIENDDPRIVGVITDGSQLNVNQYRNGNFYIGGASNEYTAVKPASKIARRRLLQIVCGRDDIVPADGGKSVIPDGTPDHGTLMIVPWQESALAFAAAWGHTGGMAALDPDNGATAQAAYLDGRVTAVIFKDLGHVAGAFEPFAHQAISAFVAPGKPTAMPGAALLRVTWATHAGFGTAATLTLLLSLALFTRQRL